jgi:choline-sulfatase
MATAPPRPVERALWAGAIAGMAVGSADALLSWDRLGQFLPGLGGKLRCALFAGGLYGFVAALVAAAAAAMWHFTALGPLAEHALARHREARAADPRRALAGLGLALAAGPCLAAALVLAYRAGVDSFAHRHRVDLVVAYNLAVTLGLLVAAAVAALVLGRLVELLLRPLPRAALRPLSHPAAPAAALALLLLAAGLVLAWRARETLALLPLRPYLATAALLAACPLARPAAAALLARARPRIRPLLHPVAVAGPLVLALVLGSADAVRKGASAGTGLATAIAVGVRQIFDLDRDGYSSVLGGGDCNDLDPSIHPGAFDIPDDGIDQNCLGGDVHLGRRVEDVGFAPVPAAVPADANVLLISIDALRADHLGAYGYRRPTTPALDALAARGARFENFWAHAPSTRYSIPALITGRYPSQVLWDMSVWWPALRLENHTLAEIMKERGLRTSAILSYSYFDPARRMNQGFDDYDNSNARLHVGQDPASTRGSSSREQADAAIRWLDAHGRERFFLWVHFYDPHFEYETHPGSVQFGEGRVDRYDGEIRFTDDHIGRVLAHLAELGVDGKTIVVVTGDHGEGFGEHGIQLHGYHLYAAQTRVPLIVFVPGLAPRRISTPAGHVDILPTLANLVGAPAEATMLGRSLVPLLDGSAPAEADRDVFQEVSFEGPTERRGLATKGWHLLYNMVPDGTFELYDLARDPAEAHDRWGSAPIGAELRARLLSWIDVSQFPPEAATKLAAALPRKRPAPAVPLDVDLGGAVRLLGVDLGRAQVRAGDDLEITWYWQSEKPLAGAWRPFVHVEGPTRFLGDHDPVDGLLPMARWHKGQVVADRQRLRIPPGTPAGSYTIFTGVYQRGERLPVSGVPDSRIRVTTITVEP